MDGSGSSEEPEVEIRVFSGEDSFKPIEDCDLDSTLAELKDSIRRVWGTRNGLTLYYHQGEAICCDEEESTKLQDLFGEGFTDNDGKVLIEVDYITAEAGPSTIVNVGNETVAVLNNGQEITVRPSCKEELTLKRERAFHLYPRKLLIVEKEVDVPGLKGLVVREYSVLSGEIKVNKSGRNIATTVKEELYKIIRPAHLFKKNDSNKFVKSQDPICQWEPGHTDPPGSIWERHTQISKDDVLEALEVCTETYKEPLGDKVVVGGTVSYIRLKGETLYIGFRGSVDKEDWLANFNIELIKKNSAISQDQDVCIHSGFVARAREILGQGKLEERIRAKKSEGNITKIVTCGHSLGGALSQLVHIHFQAMISEMLGTTVEFVNVTFATPMVGNFPLRAEQNREDGVARNMFHFVLAEDVVPAALFTADMYNKLPWFAARQVLNVLLWIINLDVQNRDSVDNLMTQLKKQSQRESRTEEMSYAPVGHYFYVKRVGSDTKLYELDFDQDPQYISNALICALDALNLSLISLISEGKERDPRLKALKLGHGLLTYKEKLSYLFSEHRQ